MASCVRLPVAFLIQAFLAMIVLLAPMDQAEAAKRFIPPRYQFEIDPKTPLAGLLPAPPSGAIAFPPIGNTDLANVPEVMFGAPLVVKKDESTEKALAHAIAKINHLNQETPDAFMRALISNRGDLRGLPFRMGKDCQSDEKHAWYFREMVRLVHAHRFLDRQIDGKVSTVPNPEIWKQLREKVANPNRSDLDPFRGANREAIERATVAALMQIFGPAEPKERLGLARYLAELKHSDAGNALANLALFAPEKEIRAEAIGGLARFRHDVYDKTLMQGFRYPLPMIAKRAAEAIAKTNNQAVLDALVKVLEQPDPRAPAKQTVDGAEATVIHEVVRVNHHRNCVLCHAPGNTRNIPEGTLTVASPLPDEALPQPNRQGGGYGSFRSPDIFVRIDVTYLRQDFSMMMKVDNAKPWPEMQRFDFLVRSRVATPEEAATRTKELTRQPSPYHAAAQYALREVTGQTPADATAAGWRRLLAAGKD